jgi:hypothetical protein
MIARDRLRFETAPAPLPAAPLRTDVACVVGLCAVRASVEGSSPAALPEPLRQAFRRAGLTADGRRPARAGAPAGERFVDVPVPVESFAEFDRFFAWDERPVAATSTRAWTWLGAAVRAFFEEGGRRAHIVAVHPPPPLGTAVEDDERAALLAAILPPDGELPDAAVRGTWRGVGNLFRVPEAALLVVPDLPELTTAARAAVPPPAAPPVVQPRFGPCDEPASAPADTALPPLATPRHDASAFARWEGEIARLARWLERAGRGRLREVTALLALPQPLAGDAAPPTLPGVVSERLQLAYPWFVPTTAPLLPEGRTPPDAGLAGLAARNALARGTFRSLAGLPLRQQVTPVAARVDDITRRRACVWGRAGGRPALATDRTPAGADVALDRTQGQVARLVASIRRAARLAGETVVFEGHGERLWQAVTARLGDLLRAFVAEGALAPTATDPAFTVRCDATTTTPADIAAGRLVVLVTVRPTASVEAIEVRLPLAAATSATEAAS